MFGVCSRWVFLLLFVVVVAVCGSYLTTVCEKEKKCLPL